MALRNTESSWGSLSKWLHWVIAVLILTAITCAIWADQLDPEVPGEPELWAFLIMKMHKPLGLVAGVLIGLAFAAAVQGLMRRFLPDSGSIGLGGLVGVTLLVSVIALLGSYLPARQAARRTTGQPTLRRCSSRGGRRPFC